ncbi:unnamed protein product [Meganyctiphanes norvegica]|uniref:C2H2-type domain-containing protein n=1 Tax=Meganyctiphanes norvegica TaxID=48144 RepID=A0AAV2SX18_MEGNR
MIYMSVHNDAPSTETSDQSRPALMPFACSSVIISFAKLEYDNHIEITHTEVCTKYEYKCVIRDVFNEHMESHDSEINSFKCSECVYVCTSQDLLHIHMGSHKRSAVVDNQRRRSRVGSDMRKGSISKSNVWDKLSLDDLARQHFIETLISNDGFSANIKNGKPIRPKDVQMPPSNGSTP